MVLEITTFLKDNQYMASLKWNQEKAESKVTIYSETCIFKVTIDGIDSLNMKKSNITKHFLKDI